MLSQNSKQRFLWVGLAAVLVGALLGLPWVTSAAPKEEPLAASHLVSREHAEELIARFRATAEPTSVRAHSFDRSAFDALLAQPEAEGIRIYYGKYADGTDTVVLYATDENGRDLSAMPANNSRPCPPSCPEEEPSAGTLRRYATTSKQKHPVDSHLVGQEYAEELIARYRTTAAPGAARAQSFDRSAFDVLLAQPGAEGIRIYYGKYADGTDAAVLYATDKNGQDLSAMPANMARPCPPYCPEDEPSIGDLP